MKEPVLPDALDLRILEQLRLDGRASWRSVARAIGSTTPTVSLRVRRMRQAGLIEGFSVRVRDAGAEGRKPERWTCVQCRGPFHGPALSRRIGGTYRAFCCRGCVSSYRARYKHLTRDPEP